MAEPALTVAGVKKTFHGEQGSCPALDGITFTVARHEIVCFMGPSGCGKSTLLRIIGGLDHADAGTISGGTAINGASSSVAMVFQDHALFPWLTVLENLTYGLRLKAQKLPEKEVQSRSSELLSLVHLGSFEHSFPHQLSGGMKQRVSVARALAIRPSILLLDEPFSALDTFTRRELEDEILRIREELSTTILMVTHNPEEAVYIADRVIVLSQRPAVVSEIFLIDLPHPRSPSDPEFVRIRELLISKIQGIPENKPA